MVFVENRLQRKPGESALQQAQVHPLHVGEVDAEAIFVVGVTAEESVDPARHERVAFRDEA